MPEERKSEDSYANLLCALSLAADLNMGQPMEHGLRTVLIASQLADAVKLSTDDKIAVYYGGLLKDAG